MDKTIPTNTYEKNYSFFIDRCSLISRKENATEETTASSDMDLTMSERIPKWGGSTVSYGSKIGNALKSGFNMLSTFFLGLLHIWPFIIIFVIAFVLIRKRIRTKK